jgi:hypothetical protein
MITYVETECHEDKRYLKLWNKSKGTMRRSKNKKSQTVQLSDSVSGNTSPMM